MMAGYAICCRVFAHGRMLSPLEGCLDEINPRCTTSLMSGGAGGHYTWGTAAGDLDPAPVALDKNDPNYDPDDGPEQLTSQ